MQIIHKETFGGKTYYVVESRAAMPTSCWGRYAKVAIIEQAADAAPPAIIRDTARGTVLYVRDRLHDGGDRSARARAEREYIDRVQRMSDAYHYSVMGLAS